MKVKCKNPRCMKANKGKSYEWDYNGDNPLYASCPRCKSSIKLPEEKMFVDKCKVCKKEITGYSEAQVNRRMEMHMRSHQGEK